MAIRTVLTKLAEITLASFGKFGEFWCVLEVENNFVAHIQNKLNYTYIPSFIPKWFKIFQFCWGCFSTVSAALDDHFGTEIKW